MATSQDILNWANSNLNATGDDWVKYLQDNKLTINDVASATGMGANDLANWGAANGVVTDIAGELGTDTYKWKRLLSL
jgi:hypothetical protein